MHELVVGAAKYAVGGIVARVISIASVPVYLHFLAADEYGLQAIALLNEQILLIIAGYAMVNAVGKYLYGERPDEERQGTIVGSVVASVAVVGLVVAVIWQLLAERISALTLDGSAVSTDIIRLIGVSFFFSLFFNVGMTIWQFRQDVFVYSVANAVKFLLSVGIAVVLLQASLGVVSVIVGWTIASAVTGIAALVWIQRHFKLRFDRATALQLARYGIPLVPAALLSVLLNGSDRYILKLFSGLGAVGIYATAYVLASACNFLLITPFRQAWPALMWRMRARPDEPSFHRSALRYYVGFQVFAVLAITVFCSAAMGIASSGKPEFTHAALAVPLIYVGFAISGAHDVLSAGYFFDSRTVYYTVTVSISTASNIMLNLLLVPAIGLWGSATAFALSYLVYSTLSARFGLRYFQPHHEWRRISIACIAGAVLVGAYLAALSFGPGVSYLVGMLGIGVLPLALVQAGVFAPDEVRRGVAQIRSSIRALVGGVRPG